MIGRYIAVHVPMLIKVYRLLNFSMHYNFLSLGKSWPTQYTFSRPWVG